MNDGEVKIDVGLDTAPIDNGLKEIKGKFGGLGNTLKHMGKTIAASFMEPFDAAAEKILSKQFERVDRKFNEAVALGDNAKIDRLPLVQENIMNKLAAARERLALAAQASASRQSAAETQAATKIETKLSAVLARIKSLASGVGSAI